MAPKRRKSQRTSSMSKRRNTRISRPIAPPRTGGFWGVTARNPIERKFIDTTDSTDITTTGVVVPVNLIAAGTDYDARIGRKVILKSFQIRAIFGLENASVPSGVRYLLVYDKQTNGALPAITDILNTASAQNPVTAMLNLNNRDRFVILWDKIFQLNTSFSIFQHFKKYKKLRHETVYSGTTATIGSIITGGLYVVTIGSVPAGITDVDNGMTMRVRFVDA